MWMRRSSAARLCSCAFALAACSAGQRESGSAPQPARPTLPASSIASARASGGATGSRALEPTVLGLLDRNALGVAYLNFAKVPAPLAKLAGPLFLARVSAGDHHLGELPALCGAPIPTLVSELALSISSDLDRLLVARSPDVSRLERCVAALPEVRPAGPDGEGSYLYGSSPKSVVFDDDLVFFGAPISVERALARHQDPSPPGLDTERSVVDLIDPTDDVAALSVDHEGEERGWVRAQLREGRLVVNGQFRPTGGRAGRDLERRRRLIEGWRQEIEHSLTILVGLEHPTLKGWRREGGEDMGKINLLWTFPVADLTALEVERGLARYARHAIIEEAKNNLAALFRGASGAYEDRGQRCTSTIAVPADVPRGVAYQPDILAGDFQSAGWTCLKFNMSTPMRYRYRYIHGGPYVGPSRGLPDPGPNGFEVSAEGDLDGDGKTSLFTLTGTIASGRVVYNRVINASDPDE